MASPTAGSEFSRPSTYSTRLPEGTSLTQAELVKPDTAGFDPGTFVSTLRGNTISANTSRNNTSITRNNTQGVKFADTILERSITASSDSPSEHSSLAKKPKLGPLDLKARLYDRPENNQAIAVVRQQQAAKKSSDTKKHEARPPSGKSSVPAPAFRTTMFKKDYQRRQAQLSKDTAGPGPLPQLNLHRLGKTGQEVLPDISPRSSDELPDDQSMISFGDISASLSDRSIIDGQDVKVVNLGTLSSPEMSTSGEIKVTSPDMGEDDKEEYSPDEFPSSFAMRFENRETLHSGAELIHEVQEIKTPERVDSKAEVEQEEPESHRAKSAGPHGTSKKDPSLVLTYLKKNIYDDTEPENDIFEDVLRELRERLNWSGELPRHGQGCRKKMEAISDVPKTVESAILTQEDDGMFVYALPRNRNDDKARYNPYDLQVVSPHLARKEEIYYTGSASSVTRFQIINGKQHSERTPVMWWLWEKRIFDLVFHLPVLEKFRRWKQFQVWKMNVQRQKQDSGRFVLQKTLFTANEVLQGCVIHIRSLCESAAGSLSGSGDVEAGIFLARLDKHRVLTLPEFMEEQRNQGIIALEQLNALRDKVVDMVFESCATVAEMEGITHGIRPEAVVTKVRDKDGKVIREEKKLKYKIKTRYGLIPVYEKKEEKKKDRPTYAQISEWRKILHRLSYFLRLVDYLILELLRRLVVVATKALLKFVGTSYQIGIMEEEEDSIDDRVSEVSGSNTPIYFTPRNITKPSLAKRISDSVFFVAKGPEKMKENSENNADVVDERVSSKGKAPKKGNKGLKISKTSRNVLKSLSNTSTNRQDAVPKETDTEDTSGTKREKKSVQIDGKETKSAAVKNPLKENKEMKQNKKESVKMSENNKVNQGDCHDKKKPVFAVKKKAPQFGIPVKKRKIDYDANLKNDGKNDDETIAKSEKQEKSTTINNQVTMTFDPDVFTMDANETQIGDNEIKTKKTGKRVKGGNESETEKKRKQTKVENETTKKRKQENVDDKKPGDASGNSGMTSVCIESGGGGENVADVTTGSVKIQSDDKVIRAEEEIPGNEEMAPGNMMESKTASDVNATADESNSDFDFED